MSDNQVEATLIVNAQVADAEAFTGNLSASDKR